MNREVIVSFVGESGRKIANIYYDTDTKYYYVHYKFEVNNINTLKFFVNEKEAEESAQNFAFGDENGKRVI